MLHYNLLLSTPLQLRCGCGCSLTQSIKPSNKRYATQKSDVDSMQTCQVNTLYLKDFLWPLYNKR